MILRAAFPVIIALVLMACGRETPAPTPGGNIPSTPEAIAKLRQTIQVDGAARTYVIHVPAAVRVSREPVPLVVFLHGATDDDVYAYMAYGLPELAEKEHFIVVFPDGIQTRWDAFKSAQTGDSKDDRFLDALLGQIKHDYPIDARRIYLAGHSNGAMMAGTYGARHSDQIAALGLVAGTAGWECTSGRLMAPRPKRPIPVMIEHGMKDGSLSFWPPKPGVDWQAISPEESAAFWASAGGAGAPTVEMLNGGRVRHLVYNADNGRFEVAVYFLTEGNHMWPGGRAMPGKLNKPVPDLATTDMMWAFFKNHPL